jgi:hypothetical protein
MTAIDFPDTPTVGDLYTVGSITWKWDGITWKSLAVSPPQNLDGGKSNTNYGGIISINGGNAESF